MKPFVVALPFAYDAEVRLKRKRTFQPMTFSGRAEFAIPRAGEGEIPIVMRRKLPDGDVRKGTVEAIFRHDGHHFFKPFEPWHGKSIFEKDMGHIFDDKVLSPSQIDEYPLADFPSVPSYRRTPATTLSRPESRIESFDVSEVRNSQFDAVVEASKLLVADHLRSIDGQIFIRCEEPVYTYGLEYWSGSPETDRSLSVGLTAWRDRDALKDRLLLPVRPDRRGGIGVEQRLVDDIIDPSAFEFDPLVGNRIFMVAQAKLGLEKHETYVDREDFATIGALCSIVIAADCEQPDRLALEQALSDLATSREELSRGSGVRQLLNARILLERMGYVKARNAELDADMAAISAL